MQCQCSPDVLTYESFMTFRLSGRRRDLRAGKTRGMDTLLCFFRGRPRRERAGDHLLPAV